MLRALLWDLDGTLAETERDGHLVAFNLAFAEAGLARRWDDARYAELLAVSGGFERLLHDMPVWPDAPKSEAERKALARSLHLKKNDHYARWVAQGHIPLRAGVAELMRECQRRGLRMAITTTTSRSNVAALMSAQLGSHWADTFALVLCGDDVSAKKPDPEVYLRALKALGIQAHQALAVEDSPAGVLAARGADIAVIVTRSHYFAQASVPGAMAVGPGLHQRRGWLPALRGEGGVSLDDLMAWQSLRP